jgi:hypothetical protein
MNAAFWGKRRRSDIAPELPPGKRPACPLCGQRMMVRRWSKSRDVFWGCPAFFDKAPCKATVPINQVAWSHYVTQRLDRYAKAQRAFYLRRERLIADGFKRTKRVLGAKELQAPPTLQESRAPEPQVKRIQAPPLPNKRRSKIDDALSAELDSFAEPVRMRFAAA